MTTQADTREAVLIELDGLLETQGRLLFARNDYNEAEATDFGVQLLDFMRRHGVIVRQALSQWSHGEPASLKRDGEQRALTRPEASANTAGENPAGSIFETCPICESEVAAASDHKCRLTPQATALTELRAECERLRGELSQAQRHHVLAMESKHTAWELAIEQRDIAEARADKVERLLRDIRERMSPLLEQAADTTGVDISAGPQPGSFLYRINELLKDHP